MKKMINFLKMKKYVGWIAIIFTLLMSAIAGKCRAQEPYFEQKCYGSQQQVLLNYLDAIILAQTVPDSIFECNYNPFLFRDFNKDILYRLDMIASNSKGGGGSGCDCDLSGIRDSLFLLLYSVYQTSLRVKHELSPDYVVPVSNGIGYLMKKNIYFDYDYVYVDLKIIIDGTKLVGSEYIQSFNLSSLLNNEGFTIDTTRGFGMSSFYTTYYNGGVGESYFNMEESLYSWTNNQGNIIFNNVGIVIRMNEVFIPSAEPVLSVKMMFPLINTNFR